MIQEMKEQKTLRIQKAFLEISSYCLHFPLSLEIFLLPYPHHSPCKAMQWKFKLRDKEFVSCSSRKLL